MKYQIGAIIKDPDNYTTWEVIKAEMRPDKELYTVKHIINGVISSMGVEFDGTDRWIEYYIKM
jgi:hypothetical protein